MGGSLTIPPQKLSLEQQFQSAFPFYLAIGMTPRQFWQEDPWLARAYREAHALCKAQRNQELWLQGAYVYDALAVALGNMVKEKGAPVLTYMDEPLPLTKVQAREQAERQARKKMEAFKARFVCDIERLALQKPGGAKQKTEEKSAADPK